MTAARRKTGWDPDAFAKVRNLHVHGATAGERAAAGTRMEVLAKNAGLTVAQAVARLTPAPAAQPINIFEELFNSPAFKAQAAAREVQRAQERADALARYGSAEAVWAETENERLLKVACAPFVIERPILGGMLPTLEHWSGGRYTEMSKAVQAAVVAAYPAETVRATWIEFQAWSALYTDRAAFDRDYEHALPVRARVAALEHRLDTLPARSMNDLRARLDWMDFLNVSAWNRGNPEDALLLGQLRADCERLGDTLRRLSQATETRSPPPETRP